MRNDLIKRARTGLQGTRRVRSVFLRRSVSDAYYALFHALAALCADHLVGVTKRNSEAWRRVYRGLDHARVREEFRRKDVVNMDLAVGRVAAAFVQLQEARHAADYDPLNILRRRSDAEAWIGIAETAVADLDGLPDDLVLDLAACLLMKRRA